MHSPAHTFVFLLFVVLLSVGTCETPDELIPELDEPEPKPKIKKVETHAKISSEPKRDDTPPPPPPPQPLPEIANLPSDEHANATQASAKSDEGLKNHLKDLLETIKKNQEVIKKLKDEIESNKW